MRILVTGAAGFIGSHVAARLSALGHRVIGCDNFNAYYAPKLKYARVRAILAPRNIECRQAELSDAEQTKKLFDNWQPTHVAHLAAQAGVRYSIENPESYVQSNLVAFSHVLEACRKHQVQHLLYASSSSVYGDNAKAPFQENDRTDEPASLYAATKKANELMAYSASRLYKFPATGVRFFTVYGPWGRPDMAYFSFTEKMIQGEPIPVYAQGELYRDFTYIDDIVEGVARLLFKPQPLNRAKPAHAVFNIGNQHPIRVKDFIATLERVLHVKANIQYLPMQPGDALFTHADTAKLRDWVGFVPATSLEDGLIRFRNWYYKWANNESGIDSREIQEPEIVPKPKDGHGQRWTRTG